MALAHTEGTRMGKQQGQGPGGAPLLPPEGVSPLLRVGEGGCGQNQRAGHRKAGKPEERTVNQGPERAPGPARGEVWGAGWAWEVQGLGARVSATRISSLRAGRPVRVDWIDVHLILYYPKQEQVLSEILPVQLRRRHGK